ncbi:hypothetical protein E2C01_007011 [Portunus trituberculatus]|uniref:Uncharacterized protein n=1 Tax=Portunus trituberculatus TaxID=210409 RepID=A0A5B7CY11_PORTR|nr:hypothetical protein [Portunus trituberculatus]
MKGRAGGISRAIPLGIGQARKNEAEQSNTNLVVGVFASQLIVDHVHPQLIMGGVREQVQRLQTQPHFAPQFPEAFPVGTPISCEVFLHSLRLSVTSQIKLDQ